MTKHIPLKEIIKMYLFYLHKHAQRGLFQETSDVAVRNDEYYDNYDSFVSADYVTRIYAVIDYPKELMLPLSYYLKTTLPRGIKIDIITGFDDNPLDMTTPYMQRLQHTWEKSINKNKPKLSKNKMHTEQEYVASSRSEMALTSWNLINQRKAEGCRTINGEVTVLLRYSKQMSLKEQLFDEHSWIVNLKSKGISIEKMKKMLFPLFHDLSPTVIKPDNPIYTYTTLLDENIAYFESYLPGKLEGKEVFLGINTSTNMCTYSDLLDTAGDALNILMVADTGSGKSAFIKSLCLMLTARHVNIIIWDKNGEYTTLCSESDSPVIALGANGGYYFNTVSISEMDPDGYSKSISDTLAVFDILCNPNTGMTSDEKYLIQEAYTSMFEESNIYQSDRTSWVNSHKLDYIDLYKSIRSLTTVDKDLTVLHKELCRKLSSYFDKNGLDNQIFVKPININDILHKKYGGQPMIICINMETGIQSQRINTQIPLDKIKSLTMSSLTDRIVFHNKMLGELTSVIVEEVERHTFNASFIDEMHAIITDGRKRNLIPILITNSLGSMKNNPNSKLHDILNNINTLIVGALKDDDVDYVIQTYDLGGTRQTLEKIRTSKGVTGSPWRFAFQMRVKSKDGKQQELAVIKMPIPPDVAASKIIKTRD